MKLNFLSGLVSRLTLMMLLALTALPASSATVSVEVDSATLTFSTSGGTATLTRVGVAGYSEVRIPETITVDGETYTVTGISSLGNLAKYITAISIPGTVGDVRCFGESVNLKTLTIEPGPSVLTIGLLTASYGEYYPAVRQFANCPLETVNLGRTIDYGYQPEYGDLYDPYVDKEKYAGSPFNALVDLNITGDNVSLAAQMVPETDNLRVSAKNTQIFVPEKTFGGEYLNVKNVYIDEPIKIVGQVYSQAKNIYYKDYGTIFNSRFDVPICRYAKLYIGGRQLDKVVIPEGYVEIPDYAFYESDIKELSLPSSVKRIGKYAFSETSLINVKLNSVETIDEKAFSSCNRLNNVDFGSKLVEIGDGAFFNCQITTANLPATLRVIGASAFSKTALTRVEFAQGCALESIGESAFVNTSLTTIRLPEGLKNLGRYAFQSNNKLTFASLGKSLKLVDSGTFEGCLALSEIEIPSSVTEIGGRAFSSCSGLVVVTLNEGLEKIGASAFNNTAISQLTIPASVKAMARNAFSGTSMLNFLTITDSETPLAIDEEPGMRSYESMFAKSPLRLVYMGRDISYSNENGLFENQKGLKSVTLSRYVTYVGRNLFKNCTSLPKVTFTENLKDIYSGAFSGCVSLKEANLVEGLETIGSYSFDSCPISKIDIPSTATTVGAYAFRNCRQVTELTLADSDKSINMEGGSDRNQTLFGDCPLTKLYVGRDVEYMAGVASPFRNQENLTTVAFSDTKVTNLGINYLRGCSAVETIKLPSSLKAISHGALSELSSLKALEIPANTEAIGDSAFARNKAMAEVKMICGVKTPGKYLFTDCTGLKSISLCEGLQTMTGYMFNNCESLLTVKIPTTVSEIESYIFENCRSLDNITIPDKVKTLNSYVFNKCQSLAHLNLGKGLETINPSAITGCRVLENIVIPTSVTIIKSNGFNDNRNLKNLTIAGSDRYIIIEHHELNGMFKEEGVENLYLGRMLTYTSPSNPSPFAGSQTLKKVEFGPDIVSIQPLLFKDCNALEGAIVGDAVTTISESAFSGCLSLSYLSLGKSLVSIGEYAFSRCASLKILNLPESMREISEEAFYWSGLTDIDFAKIETIGPKAFMQCNGLERINLPETLFGIGVESFRGCANLQYVDIPAGPRNVGSMAFKDCINLKWISLGRTVTSIGNNAFAGCEAVDYIKSYNTTPPQGLTGFSSNVEASATLYVPAQSIEMYKLTPAWENFFNIKTLDDVVLPSAITLDRSEYTIYPGQNFTLTVSVAPAGALAGFEWHSSDPEVATVNQTGVVTAGTKAGETVITVTSIGNPSVSASCRVTLSNGENPITALRLSKEVMTTFTGSRQPVELTAIYEPANATVSDFKWTISDESVASYFAEADGGRTLKFFGDKPGEVTITVTSGGLSATCRVQVLTLNKNIEIKAATGSGYQLPSAINGKPLVPVEGMSYTSRNEAVATVDANGLVSAHKAGNAIIDVMVYHNGTYSLYGNVYTVEVVSVPAGQILCNGMLFDICNNDTEATITNAAFNGLQSDELVLPSEIVYGGKTYPVVSFESGAFSNISRLDRLVIPNTFKTFSRYATGNLEIGTLVFEDGDNPIEINYNEAVNVKEVYFGRAIVANGYSGQLLNGNKYVRKAEIGGNVTEIIDYLFANSSLQELVLNDKISTVGERAFYGCASLSELTLPATLKQIGSEAFSGTSQLTTIKCYATELPALGRYALWSGFETMTTLYVPAESLARYKADKEWSRFLNILPLETGIGDIEADDFKVSVYTLGGVMLIENADREQYDALAPGIYIVNGRKVYKKR